MKKLILLVLLVLFFCPAAIKSNTSAAQTSQDLSQEEIAQELEENVSSQLDSLDFSSLDEVLSSFSQGQISIFGGKSFLEKVSALLSGEYDDSQNLWQAVVNAFLSSLLGLLPVISAIIGISILGSLLQGIKPSSNGKSMASLINFVSYGIVVA